jgi:hypothetical protein
MKSISTNSQRSAEKMCTCNLSSDANAEVSYLNQVQIEDVAKCNNLLMRKKIWKQFPPTLSKICRKNVHKVQKVTTL